MKLGDIITALIEAMNGSKESSFPENVMKAIRDCAGLIHAGIGTDRVLETSSLDREYRLACQSVQTMSICQHVAGNTDNTLVLKEL